MTKITNYKKFLEALTVPEGFSKEIYTYDRDWDRFNPKVPALKITGDGVEILVIMDGTKRPPKKAWAIASGHTSFDTSKGRMSFDRTGVEDSFYVDWDDTLEMVNEKISRQLEKVAASRERLTKAVTVPVLGYNLSPERFEQYKATLKAGKTVSMDPSGFGTGHLLSTKPRLARYGVKKADPKINEFFGVGPLWIEEFDHD